MLSHFAMQHLVAGYAKASHSVAGLIHCHHHSHCLQQDNNTIPRGCCQVTMAIPVDVGDGDRCYIPDPEGQFVKNIARSDSAGRKSGNTRPSPLHCVKRQSASYYNSHVSRELKINAGFRTFRECNDQLPCNPVCLFAGDYSLTDVSPTMLIIPSWTSTISVAFSSSDNLKVVLR